VFDVTDSMLEQAILRDDAAGVAEAVANGARANSRGRFNVTPVEFAVGNFKVRAAAELLRLGADPNLRDDEGNNAVTLAVDGYLREPSLLSAVLDGGGDPNTRHLNGEPVLVRFVADRNLGAIRMMKRAGADLDLRSGSGLPFIIEASLTQDWDVVWTFLELGARYNYPDEPYSVTDGFANPNNTPPDSPLWPFKEKVWSYLSKRGFPLPPLYDGRERN